MKRSVIIGIIITIIVALSVISIGTLSQIWDFKKNAGDSTPEEIEDEINQESKPLGRELSIELEEKMGISAP